MRRANGWLGRGVLFGAAATLILTMAAPAGATQAFPTTNDQSTTIGTAWWAYVNVTPAQVSSLLSTNSARLTEIRVENPTAPTFDVTMVSNSGAYASGWYWWYGLTPATLSSHLSSTGARLISLDPYVVSGNTYFAAVAVPNTGSRDRAWWYYYGQTPSGIASTLASNNARLTSLRPYSVGGKTYYAVLEIQNEGYDFADYGWAYGFKQTTTQITNQINSGHDRLISIAADPGGNFDVVYIGSEGEGWTWWYGLSAGQLVTNVLNAGERLIDITSYVSGTTRVYAGVALDDSNISQSPVNAASTNVANYANTNGWGGGFNGAYFASATSPGTAIVAYNSSFRFEPASTIKVLYLTYALQRVQAGTDSLSSSFTYYVDPSDPTNPGVCPSTAWEVPANAVTTTLGNALALMMQNSDNRVTRGMEERYGIANVQSMATSLGMSKTGLRQAFIGCGFQGGVRNELTLTDAATLYASVQRHVALNAASAKKFFSIEAGGVPSSTDYLTTVVDQEAAKLGKSSIAAKFLAAMNNRWKGGSYSFCMANGCALYKDDYSIAGALTIPFKNAGVITPHVYVYGDFVNDLNIPCAIGSGCAAETAAGNTIFRVPDEAARGTIDKALNTW